MPGGSATGGQPQTGRGIGGMGAGGFGNQWANRASQLFGGGGQPGLPAMFGGAMGMPGMMPPQNPMTGNTTANPGSPNPANPMMGNAGGGGPYGMLGPMLMGGGSANPMNMNPVANAIGMLLQGKLNPGG